MLPYELKIIQSEDMDPSHLKLVTNFAKDTGDYKSLSQTDLKVIALGLQLAKANGEYEKVKKEPKPLAEFKPKRFMNDYQKIEEIESDSDEEEQSNQNKDAFDDGFT